MEQDLRGGVFIKVVIGTIIPLFLIGIIAFVMWCYYYDELYFVEFGGGGNEFHFVKGVSAASLPKGAVVINEGDLSIFLFEETQRVNGDEAVVVYNVSIKGPSNFDFSFNKTGDRHEPLFELETVDEMIKKEFNDNSQLGLVEIKWSKYLKNSFLKNKK